MHSLFLIGYFIPFGTCLTNIRLFVYQNKIVLSPVLHTKTSPKLGGTHLYIMYMLHVIKKGLSWLCITLYITFYFIKCIAETIGHLDFLEISCAPI